MNIPAFITTEKKHDYPILIVDKLGIVGEALATQLEQEFLIIIVSQKKIEKDNIIHIPYVKKIPTIPDNTYSHIFIIDEFGNFPKQFLSSFIKKAKHDNSILVLVINSNLIKEDFIYDFTSSLTKAKILLTGDVFAKDLIYDSNTYINKFIKEIRHDKKITIPGDGTQETTPVFFDDLILGILQVGFIEKEQDKIFFLYPKDKSTLISLAHMFQKIDPNLKIDFVKQDKELAKLSPNISGKYLLEDNYDLETRIKKIDFEKEDVEEVKRDMDKKEKGAMEKYKSPYVFLGIFLSLFFFFLLPLISTLTFAASGAYFLGDLKYNIEKGNFQNAKNSAYNANTLFGLSKLTLALLEKEADFLGQKDKLSNASEKINQGKEISYTASTFLDNFEKIKNIISSSSKNQAEEFSKISDNFKNSLVIYQKQKQAGNIPASLDKKLSGIISFTSSTIDIWPEVLGFKGKKTYLVLFENNMELRPGGGFIGSYGILSLQKGRVDNFKIYDVYDADGQLKNHVEPPFAIRRYLPSPNWYLRDSNFDIDFSKGALASAVFLNSEMKQSVDGVIGVDLSFVKNLLSATGPVNVTDYNETVDQDNLFKITQSHAENNFFPGSTQKKDFLKSLFNAIQLNLSQNKNISYLNLLQSFTTSLNEKHIIFAFNNIALQSIFSINGWGSTLFDQRALDNNPINDFIGINEANLGGNKVNYYISRSINQNAAIEADGTVNENIKINFKNSADKNSEAKGVYKNYFRIILPQEAVIKNIQIDGKDQNIISAITDPTIYEVKSFVQPTGFEVNKENQAGKTSYGFLLLIASSQLKTININYVLFSKLDLSKPDLSYDLRVFKQPGIDNYPYSFSLVLPKNLTVVNYPSNSNKSENGVILSTQISKDQDFSFTLVKQ